MRITTIMLVLLKAMLFLKDTVFSGGPLTAATKNWFLAAAIFTFTGGQWKKKKKNTAFSSGQGFCGIHCYYYWWPMAPAKSFFRRLTNPRISFTGGQGGRKKKQ